MPRAGSLTKPKQYAFFGTVAGLPFWSVGLTLLAAEPGLGKTSWLLRMTHEAAKENVPVAIGCYEHTAEELKHRLERQATAIVSEAHEPADPDQVDRELARGCQAVLLGLSDREDTLRSIEETLLEDYGFPEFGPALLAVDYLQRIPVVGVTGRVGEEQRAGEAAAGLRRLSRKRGWAIVAAAALKARSFQKGNLNGLGQHAPGPGLGNLLGDERVAYEADRVYSITRSGEIQLCGCIDLEVQMLKNRVGPLTRFPIHFWGARYFPALAKDGAHPDIDLEGAVA